MPSLMWLTCMAGVCGAETWCYHVLVERLYSAEHEVWKSRLRVLATLSYLTVLSVCSAIVIKERDSLSRKDSNFYTVQGDDRLLDIFGDYQRIQRYFIEFEHDLLYYGKLFYLDKLLCFIDLRSSFSRHAGSRCFQPTILQFPALTS